MVECVNRAWLSYHKTNKMAASARTSDIWRNKSVFQKQTIKEEIIRILSEDTNESYQYLDIFRGTQLFKHLYSWEIDMAKFFKNLRHFGEWLNIRIIIMLYLQCVVYLYLICRKIVFYIWNFVTFVVCQEQLV